jgi:hypothetical protein
MSTQAQGIVIPVTGDAHPNNFSTLKDYQTAVGGYIELAGRPSGLVALVNEDGRSLGLPVNRRASALLGQSIVGNLVLIGGPDDDGDWTSIHAAAQDNILEWCEGVES